MEFTIPAPMGAQASLQANMPVRKPPESTKVEAAPDTGKSRADMHNAEHHSAAFPVQDKPAPTSAGLEVEPDTLAGPPPSFQVNVLELDQMLLQKLVRLETERARGQHSDRVTIASRTGIASEPSRNRDPSASTKE